MEIFVGRTRLRPFSPADRVRLAEVANDRRIWRNLNDRFAHPYRLDDADEWIELCVNEGEPTRNFAIEVDGQVVGAIGPSGIIKGGDVTDELIYGLVVTPGANHETTQNT